MKTVLFIAMSLDGFIAKTDRQTDWLRGDGSDAGNMGSYLDFLQTVDTIFMGYTTYQQIITVLSPEHWIYPSKRVYVFTNKDIEECRMPPYQLDHTSYIEFTNESPKSVIERVKKRGGGNIWINGGANLANQCMEQDLIDIYHISVLPTILGEGLPLFQSIQNEKRLELLTSYDYNGIVDLIYNVQK